MNKEQMFEQYYKDTFKQWVKRKSRYVPSPEDAEDIVQEAFTNALKHLHTFNPEISSIATWFTHIVNNTHRRMKRDVLASVEIKEEDIVSKPADDSEWCEQFKGFVSDEIAQMKQENHRNMAWMYFFTGATATDIAKREGCPINSVEVFIKRFKKKLRSKYG